MGLIRRRNNKGRNDPKAWTILPPRPSWTSEPSTTGTGATTATTVDPKSCLQKKAETINLILLQPQVDLWRLRELCLTEGGLVNDTLRKRAWPKLVGLHQYGMASTNSVLAEGNTTNSSNNNSTAGMPTSTHPSMQSMATATTNDDAPKFEIDASMLQETQQGFASESGPEASMNVNSANGGILKAPSANKYNDNGILFPLKVPACVDQEQIERDVARCTWHLLTGTQRSRRLQHKNKHRKKVASLLKKKQRRLANLINLTLSQHAPGLRYYQGYHDVACIFLHALGDGGGAADQDPLGVELPARVLGQVSQFQLRDSCRTSFASLQQCLQWTLFPLLAKLDPVLHNHLQDCDMEPFFCLSWILTWFSHDVRDTNLVKRLFDAFLVSHPLLVLYVSIAMMTHPINRRILLETDCDFAALHHTLSMLPRNSSRVGWKKGRQGGYVSDDENAGDDPKGDNDDDDSEEDDSDDETADTGITSSYWDQSLASSIHIPDNVSMSLATSTTTGLTLTPSSSVNPMSHSGLSIGDNEGTSQRTELVPFQLLIETALGFMKHYPPSCLMELALWYYQYQNLVVSPTARNIRMLQPPPSWALASTVTSEWVYKQRVRQELGLAKTSRKDRRRKRKLALQLEEQSQQQQQQQQEPLVAASTNRQQLSDDEFLELHKRTMAVIAAGYGPYVAKEEALFLKRKRMMMRGALVMGVTAVLMGVSYQYFYEDSKRTKTTTTPLQGGSSSSISQTKNLTTVAKKNLTTVAQETIPEVTSLIMDVPEEAATSALEKSSTGTLEKQPPSLEQVVHSLLPKKTPRKAVVLPATDPASTKFKTTASSKASVDSSKPPVLPPTLTPAMLFPSPGSMRTAPMTRPEEASNKARVFPFKWEEQFKKVALALYRYLYYWTSKLILRPIQYIKKFFQQFPPSPPATDNNPSQED